MVILVILKLLLFFGVVCLIFVPGLLMGAILPFWWVGVNIDDFFVIL